MEHPAWPRVLTLNLCREPASWPQRAPLVEAQLLALAPDVVLLQEAAWPDEQVTALSQALERHTGQRYSSHLTAVIAPDRLRPGRTWQGALGVLGRFPISEVEEPDIAGPVHVCQRVRFNLVGRALDVYNLHLDPFTPELHQGQLADLLERMRRYSDATGIILGGDLNATPDSDAVRLVATRLTSAYAATHGREPDHTVPTPFGIRRRQPAAHPPAYLTVDYIFVSPHVRVADARLAFTEHADRDPGLYPSDHYGLVADLELAL